MFPRNMLQPTQPTQSLNKNASIKNEKSPNKNFQLNRSYNPYGFLLPVPEMTKPIIQNKFSSQSFSTAEHIYNISNNSRMQMQEIYHTPKKTEDNIQNSKQIIVHKKIFFAKQEGNITPKQVKVGQQPQKYKIKITQVSTSKNYFKALETNELSNKVPSFLNRTKSPNRCQTQPNMKKFVKSQRGNQLPNSDDFSFLDLSKSQKLNQSSKSPEKIKKIQQKIFSQKDLLQSFGPSTKFSKPIISQNQSKKGFQKNIQKQIRLSVTPNKLNLSQKINKNFEKTIKSTFVPSKKSINRFNLIKLIGSSKYSQAYLCSDKKTNTIYCLKKINKSLIKQSFDHLDKFIRKISIQFTSNHPNIIQIYDVFADGQFVYLVEQYMEGGNLSQCMKNQFTKNQNYKNIQFQNKSQAKITQKLFHINSALSYIHNSQNQKRIKVDRGAPKIHGDLRPETILMAYGVCKISPINPIKIQKATSLLHPYVCPQALAENMLTHKSDMWNLGLVLYELFARKSLFKIKQYNYQLSLTDQIINMNYDKQISNLKNIPYSLKQILKLLLKVKPVQRASSDDVMRCTAIKIYEIQQIQLNKTKLQDFQFQKRFKQYLKVDALSLIKRSISPTTPTRFNNFSYNKKPQIFL